MPVKHQAKNLEYLMKQHYCNIRYSVSLAPVEVKRSQIEKLRNGDVIILNSSKLDLVLLDGLGVSCANVEPTGVNTLRVLEFPLNIEDNTDEAWQVLTFPIGTLELKTLEIGQVLEKVPMQFDTVSIESEGNLLGLGTVVWIENNLCILVNEVKR